MRSLFETRTFFLGHTVPWIRLLLRGMNIEFDGTLVKAPDVLKMADRILATQERITDSSVKNILDIRMKKYLESLQI